MNLIPVGPWYVVQSLTRCVETGKTHLSIRGTLGQWVGPGEKWSAWCGLEAEARQLASLYGGEAVPAKLIDPRTERRDWRECPHKPNHHRHDRTGELAA